MTPLRKRMLDYMTLKGYSETTKRSYIAKVRDFALHYNRCPSNLSESEVIEYLRYLREDRQLSKSSINAVYSGIKILFVNILDRSWNTLHLPRMKNGRKLPVIYSVSDLHRLFKLTENIKHRALLMLTYSAGLRKEELRKLRVKDLHLSRKLVFVRGGKGGKDRYSILSETVLNLLEEYRQMYRPAHWLFEGQNRMTSYSATSISKVYKDAKRRAHLSQGGGIHQLRHCFATHLLESGMDLVTLKQLLGHNSLKATSLYLHVSSKPVEGFSHPLDESSDQ